jgi:hypothetical protein
MADPQTNGNAGSGAGAQAGVPAALADFLLAVFRPDDLVLLRPIETWTDGQTGKKCSDVYYGGINYWRAAALAGHGGKWEYLQGISARERVNIFFGVCPRFGPKGHFDLAWQIRVVRVLWADIDNCTKDEALRRCKDAGLPPPSIVVQSGHGVHLYWLLTEPYLIDDAGDPPAVRKEFIDQGPGKKKKVLEYLALPNGRRVYKYLDGPTGKGPVNPEWPTLSAKAQHAQDIIGGIAAKVHGDHTQDLARLLRLPGTWNRKDERNRKPPVLCEVVELDAGRRYPLGDFEKLAQAAPAKIVREKVAAIPLPTGRKLTSSRRDRLGLLINRCATADDRSYADFALACWAVERGIDKEQIWPEVQGVGKFAQRGRDYFDHTWGKAEGKTRQRIYDRRGDPCHTNGRAGEHPPGPNGACPPAGTNGDCPPASTSETTVVPDEADAHLTDLGNAIKMIRLHGKDLRHCLPWRKWLHWDGRHWRADDTGTATRCAKDVPCHMWAWAQQEIDEIAEQGGGRRRWPRRRVKTRGRHGCAGRRRSRNGPSNRRAPRASTPCWTWRAASPASRSCRNRWTATPGCSTATTARWSCRRDDSASTAARIT